MTPQQQMEYVKRSIAQLNRIMQQASVPGLVDSADYYADVFKRMAKACAEVKQQMAVKR